MLTYASDSHEGESDDSLEHVWLGLVGYCKRTVISYNPSQSFYTV